MLTIGASVQTIGEEFCHILKVDGNIYNMNLSFSIY